MEMMATLGEGSSKNLKTYRRRRLDLGRWQLEGHGGTMESANTVANRYEYMGSTLRTGISRDDEVLQEQ